MAFAIFLGGVSGAQATEIPLTINGEINCAHPDNAITITCRGANPAPPGDSNPPPPAPIPTVAPQAPAEPAPAGGTITYSGDTAINCALPENKENNICLPMTNPDGSINCQQADNAITTTCWERGLAEKLAGPTVTPEVDCTLDRFKTYPVCTGIKPEAVLTQEQASQATSNTTAPIAEPKPAEVTNESGTTATESSTAPVESSSQQTSSVTEESQASNEELPVVGSISLKSLGSKSTVLNLELSAGGLTFRVVATKKGSPTITRELSVDEDGERTIKFARNLKGYTIRVLVNGEEIDRVRA